MKSKDANVLQHWVLSVIACSSLWRSHGHHPSNLTQPIGDHFTSWASLFESSPKRFLPRRTACPEGIDLQVRAKHGFIQFHCFFERPGFTTYHSAPNQCSMEFLYYRDDRVHILTAFLCLSSTAVFLSYIPGLVLVLLINSRISFRRRWYLSAAQFLQPLTLDQGALV